LLFHVLVMAPGRRSQLTDWIDPRTTDLDVRLELVPRDLPATQMLTGIVLDDQGNPLPGAVVSPVGAKTAEKRWWGQLPGVDEASVTDSDGKFVITSKEPKLGLDLRVSAPGFAEFPSRFFDLDGRTYELRMKLGVGAVGKLTFEGEPVANKSIGIVQQDRSSQTFVGERVLATDQSGSFQFTDLQPNEDYVLYTLCEGNQSRDESKVLAGTQLILQKKVIKTGNAGGLLQLGELQLEAGQTLAGRVTFPSGAKPAEEVKVRLSRDPAWDWIEMKVEANGEFRFSGLPPEVYTVSVHAVGFAIDPFNFKYQMTGDTQFGMRLRRDGKAEAKVLIPMRIAEQ
jgi:hypothetical protein